MAKMLGLLPLILQLLGVVLKWYGAGEDALADYEKLIQSTSGLMPVQARDRLLSQREAILARMKAKQNAAPKP